MLLLNLKRSIRYSDSFFVVGDERHNIPKPPKYLPFLMSMV